jgi:hypothetical protein
MTGRILLASAAAGLALYAQNFRDPAPPVVQTLPAMAPPAAKANPAVRVHGKPKALAAGASHERLEVVHGAIA